METNKPEWQKKTKRRTTMTTKSEAVRMDETLDFGAMSEEELSQISGGKYVLVDHYYIASPVGQPGTTIVCSNIGVCSPESGSPWKP
jgi:bacteriocin-like protein